MSGSPTSILRGAFILTFVNKSKAGVYADTKMEVDYNVGQILDAIKEGGYREKHYCRI